MVVNTLTGAVSALSAWNAADGFHDAFDPVARMALTASGDGFMGGGGGVANPLSLVFPQGAAPAGAESLVRVNESLALTDRLKAGSVLVWVQKVEGSSLSRLNTLSLLPVSLDRAFETMTSVNDWVSWMPRFKSSRGIPTPHPGSIHHEVQMTAGIYTFHYQALVDSARVPGGAQIRWRVDHRSDFRLDSGCKGLRVNNGSWTFAPLPGEPAETLMAYQIHVEPDVNRLLLATMAPIINGITLKEFDTVIQAMADRSTDPAWRTGSKERPSGRRYQLVKF